MNEATQSEHRVADIEQLLDVAKALMSHGVTIKAFRSSDAKPLIIVKNDGELMKYIEGCEVRGSLCFARAVFFTDINGVTINWNQPANLNFHNQLETQQ